MKIRSLLLGSVAACGLATSGYAADLGALIDCDTSNGNHDFDGFLLGASFGTMAVAMTPNGDLGMDQGGHLDSDSGDISGDMDKGVDDGSGGLELAGGSVNGEHGGLTLQGTAGGDMLSDSIDDSGGGHQDAQSDLGLS